MNKQILTDRANPERWSLTRTIRVIHLDALLLFGLLSLLGVGLMILFSAGNQEVALLSRQLIRMGMACLMVRRLEFSELIHSLTMHPLSHCLPSVRLMLITQA